MVITEIFKSIQGESTYAGLPCVFVRLTGCNLRCTWCDTAYAFYGGTKMSVGEVLARVRELSMPQGTQPEQTAGASTSQGTPQTHCAPAGPAIPLVELTGGEPLLQPDVYPLADKLLAAGYTVLKFIDRKSTRLNSSHGSISYAVFCLKKKKINEIRTVHTHMKLT